MKYLWIYLSLAAGSFQTVRNATSKTLATKLKPNAVTLVRFGYAIPFTLVYLAVLYFLRYKVGGLTYGVIGFSLLTALFQITGNYLLISLFQYKNFAVAVNFSGTDDVFAAIFGVVFFSQFIHVWGWIAILISVFGLFYTNLNKEHIGIHQFIHQFSQKSTWIGMACGACFALASFSVKFSNSAYRGGNILINAGLTLLIVLLIQTTLLLIDLFLREQQQLKIIMQNKRIDLIIGTTSALGSICWFLAFSMAQVAYVRTVGQIEIVWTILYSHMIFKEKLKGYEWVGIILTIFGITLLAFTT